MPVTPLSEFWLAVVSNLCALYEAEFTSVYSNTDHNIPYPTIAHYWIEHLTKILEGTPSFSAETVFEERDNGARDFCANIARKLSTGSSVSNWA